MIEAAEELGRSINISKACVKRQLEMDIDDN